MTAKQLLRTALRWDERWEFCLSVCPSVCLSNTCKRCSFTQRHTYAYLPKYSLRTKLNCSMRYKKTEMWGVSHWLGSNEWVTITETVYSAGGLITGCHKVSRSVRYRTRQDAVGRTSQNDAVPSNNRLCSIGEQHGTYTWSMGWFSGEL